MTLLEVFLFSAEFNFKTSALPTLDDGPDKHLIAHSVNSGIFPLASDSKYTHTT